MISKKKRNSSVIPDIQSACRKAYRLYARRPNWVGNLLQIIGAFAILLALSDVFFPFRIEPAYTQEIRASDGALLHAFLTTDDKWRYHTSLSDIPAELKRAFLLKEDRYFYQHPGINPAAIFRALLNNLRTGRRTSGASTVTMQLVRLVRPRPRTYTNKLVEMLLALRLELHYSKHEILERYLNLVPYGSNIEGVRSAARVYFDRELPNLSPAEATILTVIPNRPTSLRPGPELEALRIARNAWLNRFHKMGLWDRAELAAALSEPIQLIRHPAPQQAPHLSYRLRRAHPYTNVITTTLKPQLQARTESLTAAYIRQIRHLGVTNASVIVIDNATRSVLVYVGSADYSAARDGGQVDGIQAVRSPGSALKPLLYALAFDDGIAVPASRLLDIPTSFRGYNPENYDGDFRGPVTAKFALANSLNVPAVALLSNVGVNRFTQALIAARFDQIRADANKLGLSVILGGCGVRLQELTALYCAFANLGVWKPLQYTLPNVSTDSLQLISPMAAVILTDILDDITRPDLPNNADNAPSLPKLAWKTGTSYGRRDAWAIGYNEQYTIGVWCGNFSGIGSPVIAGADVATPLLFRIANAIDRASFRRPVRPDSIVVPTRVVCAETGLPPDTFCTSLVRDAYIPQVSPSVRCAHRRWVWLSEDASMTYCSECLPSDRPTHRVLADDLPPELLAWYYANGRTDNLPPPHNPACRHAVTEGLLAITSPESGASYYIEKGHPTRLALTATAPYDVSKLYWFVNNQFQGNAQPGQSFFIQPDTGRVSITVSDDRGRRHSITIFVYQY